LRKQELEPLGPRYEGARIGRDEALHDDEEDDPFAKGLDDASSSEDDSRDGDKMSQTKNRSAVRNGPGSRDETSDSDDQSDGDSYEAVDGEDGDAAEDDEDDEDYEDGHGMVSDDNDGQDQEQRDSRARLRKLMNEEQKNVASTISQAVKADADKGRAVKEQRILFNSLLNSRIRLQRSLISINSIPLAEPIPGASAHDGESAIAKAEAAAFKLWSSLNGLREDLRSARTGTKRKRSDFDAATSTSSLWNHMQSLETDSIPYRQSVLSKWSSKTRPTTSMPNANRFVPAASQESIIDVLTSHLHDMPRLLQRARTPRSCAPIQASMPATAGNDTQSAVYDDADLYSLLLKALLEQASADIDTSTMSIPQQWQLARQAKTKKVVDTKASKGRKIRYTVHEKLQNFMAPEDRGEWGDRQRDELFSGLLGMRGTLREDADESDEEMGEDEIGGENIGLTLFGR
jgi:protein AATF/BFR2